LNFTTRHQWIYGVDARYSEPRTYGTVHGRNEDNDSMSEFGAYLSTTTLATSQLDVVASVRFDYHDRINDFAVSPRLGLIYKPIKDQAVRFTWNRAFSSPKALDLFIDMSAGALIRDYMDLRILAPPKDGFTFSSECGGLCMRSTLHPDGASTKLPTDATQLWPAVQQMLSGSFPWITGVAAPDQTAVGSDLRYLDTVTWEGFGEVVSEDEVFGVEQDKRRITNTLEVGYKGVFGKRVYLSVDAYRNDVENTWGELYAITPNVFFNQAELEAYLQANGAPTPQDAAAAASAAAAMPMGTVAPDGLASTDVLLWNRPGADYTFWGADVATELKLLRSLSLTATYSWVNETVFEQPVVGLKVLSIPRNKGSAGLAYRGIRNGIDAGLQWRAVEKYPVASGVFVGDVEGYNVIDATIGYRIPGVEGMRISVSAQNLGNENHQEFVGAPYLGRLIVARLQWQL
jgi:iron complex outermembrane receptor protein